MQSPVQIQTRKSFERKQKGSDRVPLNLNTQKIELPFRSRLSNHKRFLERHINLLAIETQKSAREQENHAKFTFDNRQSADTAQPDDKSSNVQEPSKQQVLSSDLDNLLTGRKVDLKQRQVTGRMTSVQQERAANKKMVVAVKTNNIFNRKLVKKINTLDTGTNIAQEEPDSKYGISGYPASALRSGEHPDSMQTSNSALRQDTLMGKSSVKGAKDGEPRSGSPFRQREDREPTTAFLPFNGRKPLSNSNVASNNVIISSIIPCSPTDQERFNELKEGSFTRPVEVRAIDPPMLEKQNIRENMKTVGSQVSSHPQAEQKSSQYTIRDADDIEFKSKPSTSQSLAIGHLPGGLSSQGYRVTKYHQKISQARFFTSDMTVQATRPINNDDLTHQMAETMTDPSPYDQAVEKFIYLVDPLKDREPETLEHFEFDFTRSDVPRKPSTSDKFARSYIDRYKSVKRRMLNKLSMVDKRVQFGRGSKVHKKPQTSLSPDHDSNERNDNPHGEPNQLQKASLLTNEPDAARDSLIEQLEGEILMSPLVSDKFNSRAAQVRLCSIESLPSDQVVMENIHSSRFKKLEKPQNRGRLHQLKNTGENFPNEVSHSIDSRGSNIIDIYTLGQGQAVNNLVGIKSLSDATLDVFQNLSISNCSRDLNTQPHVTSTKTAKKPRMLRAKISKYKSKLARNRQNTDLQHQFSSKSKAMGLNLQGASSLKPVPTHQSRLAVQNALSHGHSRNGSRLKNVHIVGKNISQLMKEKEKAQRIKRSVEIKYGLLNKQDYEKMKQMRRNRQIIQSEEFVHKPQQRGDHSVSPQTQTQKHLNGEVTTRTNGKQSLGALQKGQSASTNDLHPAKTQKQSDEIDEKQSESSGNLLEANQMTFNKTLNPRAQTSHKLIENTMTARKSQIFSDQNTQVHELTHSNNPNKTNSEQRQNDCLNSAKSLRKDKEKKSSGLTIRKHHTDNRVDSPQFQNGAESILQTQFAQITNITLDNLVRDRLASDFQAEVDEPVKLSPGAATNNFNTIRDTQQNSPQTNLRGKPAVQDVTFDRIRGTSKNRSPPTTQKTKKQSIRSALSGAYQNFKVLAISEDFSSLVEKAQDSQERYKMRLNRQLRNAQRAIRKSEMRASAGLASPTLSSKRPLSESNDQQQDAPFVFSSLNLQPRIHTKLVSSNSIVTEHQPVYTPDPTVTVPSRSLQQKLVLTTAPTSAPTNFIGVKPKTPAILDRRQAHVTFSRRISTDFSRNSFSSVKSRMIKAALAEQTMRQAKVLAELKTGSYKARNKDQVMPYNDKADWRTVVTPSFNRNQVQKAKGRYFDYHNYMKGLVRNKRSVNGDKGLLIRARAKSPENKTVSIDEVQQLINSIELKSENEEVVESTKSPMNDAGRETFSQQFENVRTEPTMLKKHTERQSKLSGAASVKTNKRTHSSIRLVDSPPKSDDNLLADQDRIDEEQSCHNQTPARHLTEEELYQKNFIDAFPLPIRSDAMFLVNLVNEKKLGEMIWDPEKHKFSGTITFEDTEEVWKLVITFKQDHSGVTSGHITNDEAYEEFGLQIGIDGRFKINNEPDKSDPENLFDVVFSKLNQMLGLHVYPRVPIEDTATWFLRTRPECDDENRINTWDKIKRPSPDLFEKYYDRAGVDDDDQAIFHEDLDYCEWQEVEDDDGETIVTNFYGTRDRLTGEKHGVVRVVHADGRIYERSYKNDIEHGLEIKYKNRSVTISLNVADKINLEKSGLNLDTRRKDRINFNPHLDPSDITNRSGWHQQGLGDLYDLKAMDFVPDNWKPKAVDNAANYFDDESISDGGQM